MELFHASSVITRLEKEGVLLSGGVMHWFNTSPRTPKRPYDKYIEQYNTIDLAQRTYCEEFIDELFTQEELERLAQYLKRIQSDTFLLKEGDLGPLFIHKASLPCDSFKTGYRHMPPGGLTDRYPLVENPGYSLDFNVEGYFDLTQEGHRDRMVDSIKYVRRVLQILGLDAGIKLSQIEAAVTDVYERDRLYVTAESAANVLDNIEM